MNKRSIIITILITSIVGLILLLSNMTDKILTRANLKYQVYLSGEKIGIIESVDELYNLIDQNQTSIKSTYNVENVYPPTNLKVVAINTYDNTSDSINEVYDRIEQADDFTIRGYVITIKDEDTNYTINVLDKNTFINATLRVVNAFLEEDEYDNYINNTQEEIVDTGRLIEDMYFTEDITIKEAYISVNEKIYTDEVELSQFLLFGSDPDNEYYTVKLGDTIASIANDNQLNVEEFLIANPTYKSEDTILRVGDEVNVTLIEPQITFVYELYEISDEIVYYEKETVRDNSRPYGFSEVTTAGRNGIERYQETYTVTNGERSQEAEVELIATIQEVQNEITTVGPTSGGISNNQNPVNLNGAWAWPTNRGYVITSYRGWRWGRMHEGIDISGAGNFGSLIYAAAGGTVIRVNNSCPSQGQGYGDTCGGGMGNEVIIDHGNGYITTYAHLHQTVLVSVGDTVSRGEKIGYMGNSGSSTGAHLHFEVSYNGININPLDLYR